MKTKVFSPSVVSGSLLALALHALLFMAAEGEPTDRPADHPKPPATRYAGFLRQPASERGDARVVNSPVLFSLPSETGFSRTLMNRDVATRLTFPYTMDTEAYLEVDPALGSDERRLEASRWMAGGLPGAPEVPSVQDAAAQRTARRVMIEPELKGRLVGGIILPPILNRPVETPWEIRAEIEIGEQGLVRHVFLEEPLEDAALNHAVIRLLHGLRFRAGPAVSGRIEVYAPEPASTATPEVAP